MPGLSGSQQAYKQARSGIERSDASRTGYYTPNVVVTINSVNRTSKVLWDQRPRISLRRNDEPDTAELVIGQTPGFTPTAGQTVSIGLGTSANAIFAGQIMRVRHDRTVAQDQRYRLICSDWTGLFNRERITRTFLSQSASDIAIAIIDDHTSGFTSDGVVTGLATIDEFPCINETPASALARLAKELGGGFYIDADKRLHLWDSSGPSGNYATTAPQTLTNSLGTLKQFEPEYDFSQIRTRVICEGTSVPTVVTIPADASVDLLGVPLGNNSIYPFNTTIDAEANFARIGSMVVSYGLATINLGPPAAVVAVEASGGDTSIELVDFGTISVASPVGWFQDAAGHYFYAESVSGPAPYLLTSIPASGYGSIPTDLIIPAGTALYQSHWLQSVTPLTPTGTVEYQVEAGESMTVRVHVNDTAAQTAIAAIEGGDGIHEHVVTDSDLTYIGCVERAQAELDTFSDSLVRASWITRDMNARPGAQQVLNMSSPDTVTGTLTIDSVDIDFLTPDSPPLRRCDGSTVKLASILDAIKG